MLQVHMLGKTFNELLTLQGHDETVLHLSYIEVGNFGDTICLYLSHS